PSSVFFFQAEGGIRDGHVTGVQTCALPICRRDLELAVDSWCKSSPARVRVGSGTETASEEGPHAQVSIAEAQRIGSEVKGIRREIGRASCRERGKTRGDG